MTTAPVGPRLSALRAHVRKFPSALIGYSGGVDSACLAVVLRQELGRERMLAVIGRSASYPRAQWQAARDAAAQFDVPLLEVDTHELDDPDYAANPTNRCFFCKRELWSRLTAVARARGLAVVCDGTIAGRFARASPRPRRRRAGGDSLAARRSRDEQGGRARRRARSVCRSGTRRPRLACPAG